MNIINDPGAGGRIGKILSTGLQNLAQNKLANVQQQYQQQLQKSQYEKGIAPIVGPQVAKFLSNLSEKERAMVLPNIDALMQQFPTAEQGNTSGIKALTDSGATGQEVKPVSGGEQGPSGIKALMQSGSSGGSEQPGAKPEGTVSQPLVGDLFKSPQTKRAEEASNERIKANIESARHNVVKENQGYKAQEFKELDSARKEISKYKHDVLDRRKAAREDLRVIKDMKSLSDSGKLISGTKLKALKAIGFDDIAALKNPESEQYQKLEKFFLRNLKTIFGGRITQAEMYNYMDAIPTLMNTKEGRDLIYNDMSRMANAAILEADMLDSLENMYGKDPEKIRKIQSLVDQAVTPIVEKMYEETSFNKNTPLKQGNKLSNLPSPNTVPIGTEITVKSTGKKIRNNGTQWIEV